MLNIEVRTDASSEHIIAYILVRQQANVHRTVTMEATISNLSKKAQA